MCSAVNVHMAVWKYSHGMRTSGYCAQYVQYMYGLPKSRLLNIHALSLLNIFLSQVRGGINPILDLIDPEKQRLKRNTHIYITYIPQGHRHLPIDISNIYQYNIPYQYINSTDRNSPMYTFVLDTYCHVLHLVYFPWTNKKGDSRGETVVTIQFPSNTTA